MGTNIDQSLNQGLDDHIKILASRRDPDHLDHHLDQDPSIYRDEDLKSAKMQIWNAIKTMDACW